MRRASKFDPIQIFAIQDFGIQGSALQAFALQALAVLVALLAFFTYAPPASAADPTYPMASLVGLVPPNGMVVSKTFPGFEDVGNDSVILLAAQPPTLYEDVKKTLDPDTLKKQGITVENREDFPLSFGTGTLVVAKAEADKKIYRKWLIVAPAKDATILVNAQVPEHSTTYTDDVIRAALATLVVRDAVPDAEKLSLLPFTIGDLAGFHVQNVLAGRAVLLGDEPSGQRDLKTHLFIGAFSGGPNEPDDRAGFAREAFNQIVGIEDIHVNFSEPLRIANQPGFQTVAQAKDTRSGTNIMVAQWLRFGGGSFLQMIGMATADAWPDAQTRLRAVRDSIDVK
jgi:hypothetical protein